MKNMKMAKDYLFPQKNDERDERNTKLKYNDLKVMFSDFMNHILLIIGRNNISELEKQLLINIEKLVLVNIKRSRSHSYDLIDLLLYSDNRHTLLSARFNIFYWLFDNLCKIVRREVKTFKLISFRKTEDGKIVWEQLNADVSGETMESVYQLVADYLMGR